MKKYEFIFEKGFMEEPTRGRIIELGDENDAIEPIITVSTFAYKIFYSEKSIEELQMPFELPEYYREKTYYFGTLYTVEGYMKRFPNNKIDEVVSSNPKVFNIIQASPVGVPFAFPVPVSASANIELIDCKAARKVSVSANSDIVNYHKSYYAF